MTTNIPQAPAAARPLAQMKPKEQIAHLLQSKRGEIAKMLPKHLNAERLLKVAQIAATTTPALAKCDVASLVGAIGQCAQMGLEPNTVLGHAYLVPFNTKRKDPGTGAERWVNSVQVIIGYKGLIDLARRSGQIVSIAAHEVCEADHFDLVYGLDEKLEHRPAMGERGEVIGFYAVAKLKDGGHCFEFMSRLQVERIQAAADAKNKFPSKVWKEHFTEMGRKTVIRRLAKYLPLSIEFQTAAALDGMAEAGKDQNLDTSTIIDGEFTVMPDDMPPGDDQQQDGVIDSAAAPAAPAQAPAQPAAIGYSAPELLTQMLKAKSPEKLDEVASFIGDLPVEEDRRNLNAKYEALRAEMPGGMTAATIPAAEFAARLAGLITGLPIGAENLTHEQVARAFLRVSLEAEKLGREYAAQALGQPIPVSTTTTEDHPHGI